MIAVYSPHPDCRLRFTLKLIFRDVIGVPYKVISNEDEFNAFNGFKINYSNQELDCDLAFAPELLLYESDIKPVDLKPGKWNELQVIFYHPSQTIPFDLFAATFYLASRYEEYLPTELDKHGRFQPENSIAFKLRFLQKPIINCWCALLQQIIQLKRPEIQFEKRQFKFTPTFDIDNAWAHRNKGFLRTAGASLKDLTKGDLGNFTRRCKVVFGNDIDPNDTYEYLNKIFIEHNIKAMFFFLLGDYGKFDTNVNPTNKALQELIKGISQSAEVGIHPSYGSHQNQAQLNKEVLRLSNIIDKPVQLSRQHFLKFQLPETYNRLISAGITQDFSMGYASQPGFRASICVPFYFFDLSKNEETSLRIHPLTYMDGTLREYLKLNPQQSMALISSLIEEVKAVNGEFISLWHNDTVSDEKDWKGWRQVFESTIKRCTSPFSQ
jgi:hypothetical protein